MASEKVTAGAAFVEFTAASGLGMPGAFDVAAFTGATPTPYRTAKAPISPSMVVLSLVMMEFLR